MSPPLRILAVDDHQLFLDGLADCLRCVPEAGEVRTCNNTNDLNNIFRQWTPDIVFLDLNLDGDDGFNICRELRAINRKLYIAILTQYDQQKFIEKARAAGANAYFLKNIDACTLARFLKALSAGKAPDFQAPAPGVEAAGGIFRNDNFEISEKLTRREKEIMQLLVKGCSNEEIGQALRISYDTLKSHRSNILKKLHVKSVAELILLSIQANGETITTP